MRFSGRGLVLKGVGAACCVALLVASASVLAAEEKPSQAEVQAELSLLQERRAAKLHARQLRLKKGSGCRLSGCAGEPQPIPNPGAGARWNAD